MGDPLGHVPAPAHPHRQHHRRKPSDRPRRPDGDGCLERVHGAAAGGVLECPAPVLTLRRSQRPPRSKARCVPRMPPTAPGRRHPMSISPRSVPWGGCAGAGVSSRRCARPSCCCCSSPSLRCPVRSCRSAAPIRTASRSTTSTTRSSLRSSTTSACSTSTRRRGSPRSTSCSSCHSSGASSLARGTTGRRSARSRPARLPASSGSMRTASRSSS